ncbi:MAG: hypothetical protein EBT86_01035 [Actinobacteria bacterium]|nr:hypothetical protein [Actinomycetota bacterium]
MSRASTGPSSSHSSHSYGSPRHGSSGGSRRRVQKVDFRNILLNRSNMERLDRTLLRNGPGAADDYQIEIHRARGSSAAVAVAANPNFSPANPNFSPAAGLTSLTNIGQYAPADFEDFDLNILADLSGTTNNCFNQIIQNVSAASLAGLKTTTDNFVQPLHAISRKRLRETISQGNNSLFSFLKRSDRTPVLGGMTANGQNFGEYLLKKYGSEIGNLKYLNSGKEHNYLKDINIDLNIKNAVTEIDTALVQRGHSHIEEFIQQIRWVSEELRQVSDNILRLESLIQKKMEYIDLIASRTNFLCGLKANDGLAGLLDAFGVYVEKAYETNKVEDDFKELLECYKKWIVLKDIVSLQKTVDIGCSQSSGGSGGTEPVCSICLTDGITHTIIPCGHTFCQGCIKKQTLTCYICRGSIRDRIKIFFT